MKYLALSLLLVSCSSKSPRCLEYYEEIALVNTGNLNRSELANLVKKVNEYRPKAIGLDVFFVAEKPGDSVLVNTLNKIDNLILTASIVDGKLKKSYFNDQGYGSTDLLIDSRNEISTYQLYYEFSDSLIITFPLKVLQEYDASYLEVEKSTKEYEIIYNGNCMCFPIVDHRTVTNDNVKESLLNRKIVLLGYLGDDYNPGFCVEGERNVFPTPVNAPDYKYENDLNNMHGTLIFANIIYSIIKSNEQIEE